MYQQMCFEIMTLPVIERNQIAWYFTAEDFLDWRSEMLFYGIFTLLVV